MANYNAVTSQAQNVAATPYQGYSGSLVQGKTPEQKTGITAVNNTAAIQNPYNTSATTDVNNSASTITPTQFSGSQLTQYENPYQTDVVKATQAELNNADAQQASALQGNAIASGAFGGDRAGIGQAALAGQQDIANNATIAGLNTQNFQNAESEFNNQQGINLGAAQNTAARQLAASQQLGALGNTAQNEGLTEANAQVNAGTIGQQVGQAQNTANYNQYLQKQAYPFQTTGWLSNIIEGIGSQSGGTSTNAAVSTQTGSTLGSVVGAGLGLASLLKRGGRVESKEEIRIPRKGLGGALVPYDDMMAGYGGGTYVTPVRLPIGHTIPNGSNGTVNNGVAQSQSGFGNMGQISSGIKSLGNAFTNSSLGDSFSDFTQDNLGFYRGGLVRHFEDGGDAGGDSGGDNGGTGGSVGGPAGPGGPGGATNGEGPGMGAVGDAGGTGGDASSVGDASNSSPFGDLGDASDPSSPAAFGLGYATSAQSMTNPGLAMGLAQMGNTIGTQDGLGLGTPDAVAKATVRAANDDGSVGPAFGANVGSVNISGNDPNGPPGGYSATGMDPSHQAMANNLGMAPSIGQSEAPDAVAADASFANPNTPSSVATSPAAIAALRAAMSPSSPVASQVAAAPAASPSAPNTSPAAIAALRAAMSNSTATAQSSPSSVAVSSPVPSVNAPDAIAPGPSTISFTPYSNPVTPSTPSTPASTSSIFGPAISAVKSYASTLGNKLGNVASNIGTFGNNLGNELGLNGSPLGPPQSQNNYSGGIIPPGAGYVRLPNGTWTLASNIGAPITKPTLASGGAVNHYDDGGIVDPSLVSEYANQMPAPANDQSVFSPSVVSNLGAFSANSEPLRPQLAESMNGFSPSVGTQAGNQIQIPASLGNVSPVNLSALYADQMPQPRGSVNYGGPTADGVQTDAQGYAIDPNTGMRTQPGLGAAVISPSVADNANATPASEAPTLTNAPVIATQTAQKFGRDGHYIVRSQSSQGVSNQTPTAFDGLNPNARGMRNNNPGNLVDNAWTQSLPGYAGTDGRFAIFSSPQDGQSALDRNLQGYGAKGISTPLQIASTWAPASEKGNDPTSYGAVIAKSLGVGLNDKVDMSNPANRVKIGQAIALVENGQGNGSLGASAIASNATPPQGLGAASVEPDMPAQGATEAQSNEPPNGGGGGLLGMFGFHPSDAQRQAMLAAGLGMMAGTSRSGLVNIGQGGLAGLQQYNTTRNLEGELGLKQSQTLQNLTAAQGADIENKIKQKQLDLMMGVLGGHEDAGNQKADAVAKSAENGVTTPTVTAPTVAPSGAASSPNSTSAPIGLDPRYAQNEDPNVLRQRALQLDMAGVKGGDGIRQTAQDIETGKKTIHLSDGSEGQYPPYVAAQLAFEAQKKNAITEAVDPLTGAKYLGGQGTATQAQNNAPSTPSAPFLIDPETAKVSTSMPVAPPGGGYIQPNIPKGAKLTELPESTKQQMAMDGEFQKDQVSTMRATPTVIARTQAIAQAFKTFQSGSLTDHQHDAAALATALGFPTIAQGIMQGSISGPEWVDKEGVQSVLDTLKSATPRFAQSEFNAVASHGTPNTTNQPQANHEMVSEMLALGQRNDAFMKDWEKAKQQGWASPSAFYESWDQANPVNGFIKSAQRQIGNFVGMDLPPAREWAAGTVYVAPNKMPPQTAQFLAKGGVQPGSMFRYNGSKSAQPITPIAKSDYFSSQLGQ